MLRRHSWCEFDFRADLLDNRIPSLRGDRNWCPIVAVPARNEAERLPFLIGALGRQTWLARSGRHLRVILVLNNCDDGSAVAAASAAVHYPSLFLDIIETEFEPSKAHVGSARRLAMERAWECRPDPARSVLLTTDADAVPMVNWIEKNLQAIDAGAHVVGGHILGDAAEESLLGPAFLRRAMRQLRYTSLVDLLATLIDPLPHDPWPRHSDHTGASLAVRADVYAAVGGIPALPFREDLAFVSTVRAAGYRLRHSLDVRVRVSARLEGRASGGMADCLKGWLSASAQGLPHLVEDPTLVAARLRRRRACRYLASVGSIYETDLDAPAALWESAFPSILSLGWNSLSVPALVEIVAPDDPDAFAGVEVEAAIRRIEQIVGDMKGEVSVA